MTFDEACEFARWLEHQAPMWNAGWRVLRIERTEAFRFREGYSWGLLLSNPKSGEYARVTDPYVLAEFPSRLVLLPHAQREPWPGA